jgi:hypothetical protein
MRTYLLPIPLQDNAGADLSGERADWLASVLRHVGGYTLLADARGVWADGDGFTFHDAITPVLIACDNPGTIELLAQQARVIFRQEAVFMTELGEARFIVADSLPTDTSERKTA